jgi:cytochrome b pre-mRNA-processing protein 3
LESGRFSTESRNAPRGGGRRQVENRLCPALIGLPGTEPVEPPAGPGKRRAQRMGRDGGGWLLWRRRPDAVRAARLLDTVTRISRQPGFYGPERVPDTLEGRLEVLFLHAGLALMRLRGAADAQALAQAFTDGLFASLDDGLREAGVGDLAVPRRMRKLAGAFYGRLGAYERALKAGDEAGLAEALARNVFASAPAGAAFARPLARHAMETAAGLAEASLETLERFEAWRLAPA